MPLSAAQITMVHRTATKTAAPAVVFKLLSRLSHQDPGSLQLSRLQNFPRYSFWQDQSSLSIVFLGVKASTVIAACKLCVTHAHPATPGSVLWRSPDSFARSHISAIAGRTTSSTLVRH